MTCLPLPSRTVHYYLGPEQVQFDRYGMDHSGPVRIYGQGEYLKELSKVIVLFVALLPLAWAQQSRVYQEGRNWTQETSGSLESGRILRVSVDAGAVRVEGRSDHGITYVVRTRSFSSSEKSARAELTSCKLSAGVSGDTASIAAQCGNKHSRKFTREFVIMVPRAMESVEIHTGSGTVTAIGVTGNVNAYSAGGAIRVDDVGGSVIARTGGDAIDIGTAGGNATAHTGGGRVSIGAVSGTVSAYTGGGDVVLLSSQRDATIESGAGDIKVQACGGQLTASTSGGNIDVGNVSGSVDLESGGGSIRVASAKGPVHVETEQGRIELDGASAIHAETGGGGIVAKLTSGANPSDSYLETALGDVTVYLMPKLNLTVRASIELAEGHMIHSDFPEIQIRSQGEWGQKTVTAEGKLNGGGPVLKISTTTGNIFIARSH